MHCPSNHRILGAFKIFPLLNLLNLNEISLEKFHYAMPWYDFLHITVSGYHWVSYICEFIIFIVWKDFRHYFLSHLCTILPLFSLFRISFTWISSQIKLSYCSLIIVFDFLIFLYFILYSFYCSISDSIEEIEKKLKYKVLFLWIGFNLCFQIIMIWP